MATKKPAPAGKNTKVLDVSATSRSTKNIAKAKAQREEPQDEKPSKKPKLDLLSMYSDTMDVIAKRQGFESSSLDVAPPMSTTLLTVDMVLGGGARACMLTGAGNEQCAKTTLALVTMAGAIKENIPIIGFIDYEGSTKNSKPYVASILKTCGVNLSVDQIFGKKDKAGKWITPPRVRYRSETQLERFYDWLSELLRDLPDKRFVENNWWLIFEDDKKKGTRQKLGDSIDGGMTRKYQGGLWVKAPDEKMQGIIFVDSYTAMQPKIKDEEDIGNQFAVKASAFSKQLERVKGRMADKMVMIWGLNHLRQNPGQMYGPKETEKGGEALRQFSDVRLRQTSRSDSAHPFKAGMTTNKKFKEIEQSVEFENTQDTYRIVHIKAVKNKLWTPERETFIRIWVQDGNGEARGIDPVFDTMLFLKETGQISGSRKAMKLRFGDHGVSKIMTWQDLKLWVLGSKEDMIAMSKKAGYPPMNLRSQCFKQIKSGVAEDKYVETMNAKGKPGASEEDNSSDED